MCIHGVSLIAQQCAVLWKRNYFHKFYNIWLQSAVYRKGKVKCFPSFLFNNVKKKIVTELRIWYLSRALVQITTKFMKIKTGFSASIQSNHYSSGVCSVLNWDSTKHKIGPWWLGIGNQHFTMINFLLNNRSQHTSQSSCHHFIHRAVLTVELDEQIDFPESPV